MATNFIPDSRLNNNESSDMKLEKTSVADLSLLKRNTQTVVTDSPENMNLVFALESPVETEINEYVLIFKAGENTNVEISAPSGYALNWSDGEPTWTTGKLYEINFLSLEKEINTNKVIGVLFKEYTEE